jgi:hypothetical protein
MLQDDSAVRRALHNPHGLIIGAHSGIKTLVNGVTFVLEPRRNARMYFMPDVFMWTFLAKYSSIIFRFCFGWQIRKFSEIVRREYSRDCKVMLMIHKDSVAHVVCAVAAELVRQGEVQQKELTVLVVPSSRCSLSIVQIRNLANRAGLPKNIPVDYVKG